MKIFTPQNLLLSILYSLSLSLTALSYTTATAASNPTLDAIHTLVTEHLKQKTDQQIIDPKISIRKLSHLLTLQPCTVPLQLKDRNPSTIVGRMTIIVQCNQPHWRVFVPAVIDGKRPVIITTKGIMKGAVIKSTDIKTSLLPYKKIPRGSMIDIKTAIGMRTLKPIAANRVLRIRDLQPPYWVFKNQQVTIISNIGTIQVKTKGVALQNGVEQQQIPVKNLSSKKVIKGIVIAPNHILIP